MDNTEEKSGKMVQYRKTENLGEKWINIEKKCDRRKNKEAHVGEPLCYSSQKQNYMPFVVFEV